MNKTFHLFAIRCVKSVRIRSYSGLYFPAFGLNMDHTNSEYGHFSRGDSQVARRDALLYKIGLHLNRYGAVVFSKNITTFLLELNPKKAWGSI